MCSGLVVVYVPAFFVVVLERLDRAQTVPPSCAIPCRLYPTVPACMYHTLTARIIDSVIPCRPQTVEMDGDVGVVLVGEGVSEGMVQADDAKTSPRDKRESRPDLQHV